MTGIESIRVISFLLLAACGALCQSLPSADLPQGSRLDDPNPPEMQRPEMSTWSSLPDAPSPVQSPAPGADGVSTGALRETGQGHLTPGPLPIATYQLGFPQKSSNDFFAKYLYSQPSTPGPGFHPSTSGSFLGRISYAASSIFITRDSTGRGRLNTPYLFSMMTMAASHSAYRPAWQRSPSSTFNDFGSTMGGNAGINVYHEFQPGIRQKVRGITPKLIFRMGESFTHGQHAGDPNSIPAR